MCYNIEIIKKHQHNTNEWSGGTTTELYIYPRGAIYSERDFAWRLSSAKVEVEQSIFTPLKGVSRHIMVLCGEIRLEHEGHHKASLKAFEQASFKGDWATMGYGKVTDFNLMLAKGCKGKLECISFNKGELKDILLHSNMNEVEKSSQITEAFYIVKGNVEITAGAKEKIKLNVGDLVLVTIAGKGVMPLFEICCSNQQECKIIRTSIFYQRT
jgi:environmental stress-induced protein Ves